MTICISANGIPITISLFLDQNHQISGFVNFTLEDKDGWRWFEDFIIYWLNPDRINREVIELK